jgi:hypothetical protein
MNSGKLLLGLAAAGSIASMPMGQALDQKILVKEGDTIVGLGALETISSVLINDLGMWVALIDTDHFDTVRDACILRNGFVTLREGTTLFSPPGASLDEFDSVDMSTSGHLALCVRATIGTAREALYWNTVKVALRSDALVSPLVGAGTTWDKFDVCKINAANEIFVIGDVANPANGSGLDATLCRFKLDDIGNILETEVLLTKGQILSALGTSVNDLPNTEHGLSVNKHGDYLTLVFGLGGGNSYMINGETIVAQEQAPSPIPGRNWNVLTNIPKMWLNDNGDYCFTGTITGTGGGNFLVVKNGEKFAQSGDIYPTFSSSALINGTAAPLYVANDGNMFWRADTALSDDAFLRNFLPIVQQNVTTIDGDLVLGVEQTDNAHAVSRNGRFWAGRVDLQLGGETVLFVDFGLTLPIPGCAGNEGQLKVLDGLALPGNSLLFSMDLGNAINATPIILFSTRERIPGSDCGANTPWGELLISNAHRIGRVTLPNWNGNQASTLSVPIPADLALVDQVFFAQGVFRSPGSPAEYDLTNGMRIEIGAP